MRKIVFIISLTFFYLSALCFGQTTPSSGDDETVKISTTLVQIDVTVTDKNGKIIGDLRPEEFEIFENGEKQEITNFSFVSSDSAPASKITAKNSRPNAPLRPEQVRRTIALVVDDLTISYENFGYVKKSLRKFVDEQMRDGDFAAIARTGGSIGILQQFTADRQQLYAAIEKLRWNPRGLGGAKFGFPPDGFPPDVDTTGLRDPIAEANEFRESSIAANMIGGINYFIAGMKNLPGRKSAVVFSEGFNLFKRDITGPEKSSRVDTALEKLFDAATRASVVISTINVRGLETENSQAANDAQDGLSYLAEQTGGTAIKNTNDFNVGIERVLNEQKDFYLLGYAPDADTFDAAKRRFNKLTVTVRRADARVRYRSGFFAASGEREANSAAQTLSERWKAALVSPFAVNEITVSLNALFGSDAALGSFVRSILHVSARDLRFTDEAGGSKKAVFDVLALSFNVEGQPVEKIVKNYVLKLPLKEYERLQNTGFVYYFTFPFKKPGAYQLRVAIRDQQSEKIGAASQFVEIPDLKKAGLTLSGVVLENLTLAEWQSETPSSPALKNSAQAEPNANRRDSLLDTALRRFRRGTVLRYGFEVYSARLAADTAAAKARQPRLTTQINVWRDGKLILAGSRTPVDAAGQKNQQKAAVSGAFVLGSQMPPGDYVLQIIATDEAANGKNKSAEQFVEFEII